MHKSLENKKEDLYNSEDFEKILCLLNKYSKENRENINELRKKGTEQYINFGMNLGYKKEIDKFYLIYTDKGFRQEKILRYKDVGSKVVLLPLAEKYMNEESKIERKYSFN
ncbi:hypothetical protein [Clostridium cibarium]|nr:hypothetical protein [Clostridium cibarium]